MRMDFVSYTAVIVLTLYVTHKVLCIRCQQCGDSNIFEECKMGKVEPTECAENQNYCVVFTVAFVKDAESYIARSCTSFNTTKCQTNDLLDGRSAVICRSVCSTDGCNHGK